MLLPMPVELLRLRCVLSLTMKAQAMSAPYLLHIVHFRLLIPNS